MAPGRSVVISPRHHVTCKNGSKGAKYMRYRNGNDDHRNLVATPSVTSARITLVISMSCLLSAWARGCCPFIPKIFQSLSREASHGSRTSVAGRGAKHEWYSTSTAQRSRFFSNPGCPVDFTPSRSLPPHIPASVFAAYPHWQLAPAPLWGDPSSDPIAHDMT